MKKFLFSAIMFLAAGMANAGVVINNPSTGYVGGLGNPNTTTYGLVFTTPDAVNTRLDNFTFMFGLGNYSNLNLYAGVALWLGTGAGADIYTSASFGGNYQHGFSAASVNTGGVDLTPGTQYVAFFSAAGQSNPFGDYVEMEYGSAPPAPYIDFAWDNANGGSPNHLNWNGSHGYVAWTPAGSLSFSAPSDVPEPASVAVFALGLIGLIAASRRKRI